MKAALVVHRVTSDLEQNLKTILTMANRAAGEGAELIAFSEAALTGLVNEDKPDLDLPLGQTIPGPVTETLAELARELKVWLAIGLLERGGNRLFDTGLLFTQQGQIGLKYRRISPGWHGPKADPIVYGHGTEIPLAKTALGTFALLICGDLFDDPIVEKVRHRKPDWLLVPFARDFKDGSVNQEKWDKEETPEYAQRAKRVETTVLVTGYLGGEGLNDRSFGGAMVFSGKGQVIASHPLGQEGILHVQLSLSERH